MFKRRLFVLRSIIKKNCIIHLNGLAYSISLKMWFYSKVKLILDLHLFVSYAWLGKVTATVFTICLKNIKLLFISHKFRCCVSGTNNYAYFPSRGLACQPFTKKDRRNKWKFFEALPIWDLTIALNCTCCFDEGFNRFTLLLFSGNLLSSVCLFVLQF